MDEGRIIERGTDKTFFKNPKTERAKDFFKPNLILMLDFSSTLQPASYCSSKSLPPIHKGAELYCLWR